MPAAVLIVVDDDPALRSMLGRVLRGSGYADTSTMARAEDAETLLASFDEATRALTLVLMDVSLHPGDKWPDGCEAGRAILRRWPNVRMLFVTGHSSHDVVERCLGHPPYLIKPMPMESLLMMVRLVLDAPPWKPPVEPDRRKGDHCA